MKKIKGIILCILFVMCFSFCIPLVAEKEYLEAKGYISSVQDNTDEINEFLMTCKKKNKDAYFNKGIYRIDGTIHLANGVSLIGEEGTVFKGIDSTYQSYIRDDYEKVLNITIKNIIFDNVTMYFQNSGSDGITITQNIFANAKLVNIAISSGLQPDSNNKNGGEATGYYISKNHNSITILSNLFLRDSSSLGRGIGIYKTKNVIIKDNYFGLLEDVLTSIISDTTKALKEVVEAANILDNTSNQGYFMTAINVINSDQNTKILSNHFSLNTDVVEVGYEDKSGSTKGYNRDHIIYAKMFDGLDIIGNYFKGMNKNQDGGVKCRNGENLVIYKNILEETMILLYVQTASDHQFLKNIYIKENIFINKAFIANEKTPQGLYVTTDFLILLYNYMETAEISDITIRDNKVYSLGLKNEEIRIDNQNFKMPENVTITNNRNYLDTLLKVNIRRTLNEDDYSRNADYSNGVEYKKTLSDEYEVIIVSELLTLTEVSYKIENRIVLADAMIYVDGIKYTNTPLAFGDHEIFLLKDTNQNVIIENENYLLQTKSYTINQISIERVYTISYMPNEYPQKLPSITSATLPLELPFLSLEGYSFLGWFIDQALLIKATPGMLLSEDLTLYAKWEKNPIVTFDSCGGTSIESIALKKGSFVQSPLSPTKEGYSFKGWYKDDTLWDFSKDTILEDLTLYAKWEKEIISYHVQFMVDDIEVYTCSVDELSLIDAIASPTKEGYSFKGWYKDDTLWDFSKDLVEESLILYAKWEKDLRVIFDSCGGTSIEGITIKKGSTIQSPLPPTKEGYSFKGWYKDGVAWAFENKIVEDMILQAAWEKIIVYHQVCFQYVDGTLYLEQQVEQGNMISPPVEPKLEGYQFKGWYKDKSCLELFDFSSFIRENLILYGAWEEKTYTVFWQNEDYGDTPLHLTNITKLPNPLPSLTFEGYQFKGWYLDPEWKEPAIPGSKLSQNVTLYAKWEKVAILYTVEFYIEGEGVIANITVLENKKISPPNLPILEGYQFYGWYENDTYTTLWDFDKDAVTKDTILYAKKVKEAGAVENTNFILIWSITGVIVVLSASLLIGGILLKKRKKRKYTVL
ncbi:MAG: InlB B-repeat-containing protein [Anaeroplasma bactoclasticum]|nr:InlB B-repeat-containing protein [Anaeroplasma bactoclasticum]